MVIFLGAINGGLFMVRPRRQLTPEDEQTVKEYEEWMLSKKYSKSTTTAYVMLIRSALYHKADLTLSTEETYYQMFGYYPLRRNRAKYGSVINNFLWFKNDYQNRLR